MYFFHLWNWHPASQHLSIGISFCQLLLRGTGILPVRPINNTSQILLLWNWHPASTENVSSIAHTQ
ncbi:MAG: hypothetical protein F6K41_39135 [Symploca sp. SIO3E6]|nr:hypothetical protein [Caldora sp. SIO3E6]